MIAEIVGLSSYEARVSALLDEEERRAMEFHIAMTASLHPVIPGTGGFRKARWAQANQGKRGGLRVIYYFLAAPGVVYMASIYAKTTKDNLTAADQKVLSELARQIKSTATEM